MYYILVFIENLIINGGLLYKMKPDKDKILEDIGLSKNETKVYLALLESGQSSLKTIVNVSGVHRTNVYDALKRLIQKGIVSYIKKDKTTYYEANDPNSLMSIVKQKENKLRSILPQLKLSSEISPSKGEAYIYEGIVAVRNILNHFLDMKKPRYVYGVPSVASEMIGDFFLKKYHQKRAMARLKMYHIYNSDAKERTKLLNKLPYTESRHLSPEYDSPVATSICGDEVVLILYIKKPLVIQIRNEEIAKAYKNYFDLLWNIAEK